MTMVAATHPAPRRRARPPLQVIVVSRYPLYRAGLTAVLHGHEDRAASVHAPPDKEPTSDTAVLYDLAGLVKPHGDLLHYLAGPAGVVGLAHPERPALAETATDLGVRHFITEASGAACVVETLEQATGRRTANLSRYDDLEPPLSEREIEVLRLIANGLSNAVIAEQMFLSINTLKTNIRMAYRKTRVRTRSEAVLWVASQGL